MKQKKISSDQINEKQFQALIENAHEGIVLYHPDGRIKYVSKSFTKILGFKSLEVLGKKGIDFLHPDYGAEARDVFFSLQKKKGASTTIIQRIRQKKGSYIWSESRFTNFTHVPEINGVVLNFRDITEKRLSEERAAESQHLLETISRNLSEGIFMGILSKKFIYVNDAFLKITGYKSLKELDKITPALLYANKSTNTAIVKKLKEHNTLRGEEVLFRRKNGQDFWVEMNVSLLKHEGRDNYFVGTIRDITKEKLATKQIEESRNFLNNIINTVAAPIFVKDSQHRFIVFNEKSIELLGSSYQKIIGKSDKELLSQEEAKIFWQIDDKVLRTGKTIINKENITSQGEVRNLLTVKSRYINESGERFIMGFINDITEFKKAEEKIKQLHENLEGILESSDESIFAVDNNLCYTAFNDHHKRMMKLIYNADIKIGGNKIAYLKNAEDKKWVKAELLTALEGRHFVTEHYQNFKEYRGYIQTRYNPIKDERNKVKGVAVFVLDITDRRRFEEIIKSINSNLRGVLESTSDRILALDKKFRYITFNNAYSQSVKQLFNKEIKVGDSILEVLPPNFAKTTKAEVSKALKGTRFKSEMVLPNQTIFETSYSPIYNDKQEVTGVTLFIRDATHSRLLEEELKKVNRELLEQNLHLAEHEAQLQSALQELSERNFELDQLMYKTSHDLRSPLSSIMGLVNLAYVDPDQANYKEYLSKIDGRIKKLDDFIRSMLDYARVNRIEIQHSKIDLVALAKNCIKELEYLDNFNQVEVDISVENSLTEIRSDRLRLQIIFANIISNAYKYFNHEVKSYLHINIAVGEKEAEIKFIDNGIGIKLEHHSKIFNMFYRATERSQGSGLGMYIVKQAVEKLGGHIAVESKYGFGTTITITLNNIQ